MYYPLPRQVAVSKCFGEGVVSDLHLDDVFALISRHGYERGQRKRKYVARMRIILAIPDLHDGHLGHVFMHGVDENLMTSVVVVVVVEKNKINYN